MNGKLGGESLGEFKLGDAILTAVPPTPSEFTAIGGRVPRGIPRRFEDMDEDAAFAFVLTQV